MKHIPEEFRLFVTRAIAARCMSATRTRHMMILRWLLWQEGNQGNALPGYHECPPDCGRGYPAGWTVKNFQIMAAAAAVLLEIKHHGPARAICLANS